MRNMLKFMMVWMLAGGFAVGFTPVAAAEEIKDRFKARLPVILELKVKGIVGEDSRGFLVFVGGTQSKPDVVAAENADRRKVYEGIARQQGGTPEQVGSRRAVQIAEKAGPGEWLQDAGGNWYRK